MSARVKRVIPGSIAEREGIIAGDIIERIDGRPIVDFLDYMYLSAAEKIEITLADRELTIVNTDFEPLGIEFASLLIDAPKACRNRCVFCFIDQLPKGMRRPLYFKDDDWRLSFLQGNYVSLTSLSEGDAARIVEYSLPRINVSVHSTDTELRRRMLGNSEAADVLPLLKRLCGGGVALNCQIVLCPGLNDGIHLERTLYDLLSLDTLQSVSAVPVGLTRFRDGLSPLSAYDAESARAVVSRVEELQRQFLRAHGTRLVYLADEFYIMAGMKLPDFDSYEDFPQIENGVGMMASFLREAADRRRETTARRAENPNVSAVTGTLAFPYIRDLAGSLGCGAVYPIRNDFFGASVTVSGLVTGGDLIAQLRGKRLGKRLLIPSNMLRHEGDLFLDGVTPDDVRRELGVAVETVPADGAAFCDAIQF